jgi:hypothetical protein
MLNITNHKGNENQKYNKISPHLSQNGSYQKKIKVTNAGESSEKGELIHYENVN